MDPEALRSAARARYERGRWRWAIRRAGPALILMALAVLAGATWYAGLLWALGATTLAAVGFWLRTAWGRGAMAGVLFSLVPLCAAVWMTWGDELVSERVCQQVCGLIGVGGGALWGLWLARHTPALGRSGLIWAAGGACLGAGVGCTTLAVGSVGGILIGLLAGCMTAAGRQLLRA